MIVNQAKILEPKNFYQASIWKLDDIDEIYYPIELMNEDELPDYPYRLFFKAKFITPGKLLLNGFTVGYDKIFCIGIFINNQKFLFNRNMPEDCYQQYQKLIQLLPKGLIKKPRDLFPLRFESDLDPSIYKNFSGTFDAFEKASFRVD